MAAAILKSEIADKASVKVVEAFVAMRRFLIIDDRVYHVGASIKDLGKKWFAVSLMEAQDANVIITRLQANSSSI